MSNKELLVKEYNELSAESMKIEESGFDELVKKGFVGDHPEMVALQEKVDGIYDRMGEIVQKLKVIEYEENKEFFRKHGWVGL